MAKFLIVFVAVSVALVAAQDYSPTNYNAGDSGRSETVASDGTVQGQYSYTDPNGKQITVKYRAGKDGFQVEGDHLPKAPNAGPSAPQQQGHAQVAPTHPPLPTHPPQVAAYDPLYNPFLGPQQNAQVNHAAQNHYQQPSHAPAAPTHPPQPHNGGYNPFYNKDTANYDPLYNPHVPAHLYKDAPRSAPQNSQSSYNPFHNPHVPAHLYQQAPTHAPVAPTHPPAHFQAPTHAPAAPTHAPLPTHPPQVAAYIDNYTAQHGSQNHYQQPAPQRHQQQHPNSLQSNGGCNGFKYFC